MSGASRQHVPPRTKRRSTADERPARTESGGKRRLLFLFGVGILCVIAAAGIRWYLSANPLLDIPPVETKDVLPAVAKELEAKQNAILAHPESASAWGEYGLVLLAHGFRKEAGECFRQAEAREPDNYAWPYYLGVTMGVWDAELSLHAFERAVQRAPTRLSVRLRLAEWLFDLRRLDECQQQVWLALEQDPANARAQLLQARLLFQRGAADESLRWAEQAVRSPAGNRRDAHELLARIYQRLGNAEAAAGATAKTESLPRGVEVWDDPELKVGAAYLRDGSRLNALADVCRARGDLQGSLQFLRQFVDSEPQNFIAKQKLAATLVAAQQYDEAQKFLDQTMRAYPGSADLLYLRGEVELARGARPSAQEYFEQAIALKPDYESAYTGLGRAHLAAGDADGAIRALQEATRLGPNSVAAHRALGEALVMAQRYDEAAAALRQAIVLDPAQDDLRRQLIDALLAAGQTDAAVEQAREAVQLAREPQPFRKLLDKLAPSPNEPGTADEPGKDK